jgi:hypothetical protein
VAPAFFKVAPDEPVAAEMLPERESVAQAFVEPTPATSTEAVDEARRNTSDSLHATPTPPVPSESVAEATTSTQPTLVQAFSETEALPELPTVLENLAPLQPLGSSRSIAQQSDFPLGASSVEGYGAQPTNLQRKQTEESDYSSQETFPRSSLPTVQVPPVTLDNAPFTLQRFAPDAPRGKIPEPNQETRLLKSSVPTGGIPSSWSSIAELLGESSPDYTSANGQETLLQRLSSHSNTEDSLTQEEHSLFETTSEYSRASDSIQAFGASTPSRAQIPSVEVVSSVDNSSKQEDSKNLEILAREIYSLIQQRLAIERERRGLY